MYTGKVGESFQWTSIVNSAENTANYCKAVDWKPHFSAVYCMYTVTLKELKAALKMSAEAGQYGVVNKISVASTAQDDDFQEVKRSERHIPNDIAQTAKNSTKQVPTSATVKMPPKAVLIRNFLAPLRTTEMDTETTGAENTLPE
jgi:hypothetical protein